jgi:hypothetical protein
VLDQPVSAAAADHTTAAAPHLSLGRGSDRRRTRRTQRTCRQDRQPVSASHPSARPACGRVYTAMSSSSAQQPRHIARRLSPATPLSRRWHPRTRVADRQSLHHDWHPDPKVNTTRPPIPNPSQKPHQQHDNVAGGTPIGARPPRLERLRYRTTAQMLNRSR